MLLRIRRHVSSRRRTILRFACMAMVLVATMLLCGVQPSARAEDVVLPSGLGRDNCEDASAAHMETWWNNTAYVFWGTYIGGVNMVCSQPNLSASYIKNITDGTNGYWDIAPIWVGPQAPCTSYSNTFPSDTASAYTNGYNTATNAYNAEISLGMGTRVPVNVDLEAFDTSDAACLAAAKAYVNGWSAFFVNAGVYGSVVGSDLAAYAGIANPPQHIWGALYDGNNDPAEMGGYLGSLWVDDQRLKQFDGTHSETHDGVTLNVDSDSVDGPVYAYPPS